MEPRRLNCAEKSACTNNSPMTISILPYFASVIIRYVTARYQGFQFRDHSFLNSKIGQNFSFFTILFLKSKSRNFLCMIRSFDLLYLEMIKKTRKITLISFVYITQKLTKLGQVSIIIIAIE